MQSNRPCKNDVRFCVWTLVIFRDSNILHRFPFVRHIIFHWKAKGFRFSISGVNGGLVSVQSRNIIRDLKT